MVEMQASAVLAGMYSDRSQKQLQAAEERKKQKRGTRKMGHGKAKYFTGDDFYQLCLDDEKAKETEAGEKEERRVRREAHAGELAAWKKGNEDIRAKSRTNGRNLGAAEFLPQLNQIYSMKFRPVLFGFVYAEKRS
jgi:hypothetical protein